jgi:hypothetical protein
MSDLEKSYLAKFLVVYICGIYEECIKSIINERISKLKSTQLNKYIEENLKYSFSNPNFKKLTRLLGMFDDSWKNRLNNFTQTTQQSFNNISTNKNAIAHGSLCSITLREVIKYYNDSKQIIEEVDKIIKFN